MVTIAVIPARGGSKRIPKKNIKSFHGKPIIAYSIETAVRSKLFDRIIVSTDDEAIASLSRDYGAETPFLRPKELSDDFVGTHAVITHAIDWLRENSINVEYACGIYATAPFLQEKYLRAGYEKLLKNKHPLLLSVTTYPFPIQRALFSNEETLCPVSNKDYQKRSQDLRESYHDAAQFYWGTPAGFHGAKESFSCNTGMVLLSRYDVCDIDTPEDWVLAERMFEAAKLACS